MSKPRSISLTVILCLLPMLVWAFTDATLRDNCNRSEDPLSNGGQWTTDVLAADASTLTANGSVCVRSATAGNGSAWWNVSTFGPDTWVSATLPDATGSTGNIVIVYVRLQSPGQSGATDGYECRFRPQDDDILLREVTNDSGATLTTCTSIAMADGVKIGCEMIGTTLKAFIDTGSGWTEVCSTTDGTITSAGNIGLLTNASGFTIDTIGACTVTGGACAGAAATPQAVIVD